MSQTLHTEQRVSEVSETIIQQDNIHLVNDLQAEIVRLNAMLGGAAVKKSVYSWVEFISAGTARYGKSRGFQQAFLESFPDYTWGDIAKWRRLGVPANVMALIPTMVIKSNDPDRGKVWTDTEQDRLRAILSCEPKISMLDLAQKLTAEFGRTITEGAAKGAKKRLKTS